MIQFYKFLYVFFDHSPAESNRLASRTVTHLETAERSLKTQRRQDLKIEAFFAVHSRFQKGINGDTELNRYSSS